MASKRGIAVAVVLALGLPLLAGCGYYHLRPPYNPNIRTVYVPTIKSIVFTRQLNLQMTEMLIKEIEKRTPYKIVNSLEEADTVFEVEINQTLRNMQVENPNNLPRQVQSQLSVRVKWIDNREGDLLKDQPAAPFTVFMPFFPELGETAQLGYLKAMDAAVEEIVGFMEEPW